MEEQNQAQTGAFTTEIEVANGGDFYLYRTKKLDRTEIRKVTVVALVNNGARRLFVSEKVKGQLGLPVLRQETYCPGDGSEREVDVVGPIEVRFMNRTTTADAILLPEISGIWLGKILLNDLNVAVDTRAGELLPSGDKWEIDKYM